MYIQYTVQLYTFKIHLLINDIDFNEFDRIGLLLLTNVLNVEIQVLHKATHSCD